MPDREKVVKNLKWMRDKESWREGIMIHDDHAEVRKRICDDAIALLKELNEQKRKWLQTIADNQLANAPTDTMDATQQTYYDGVWHGLQMAWEIITGRTVKLE